MTRRFHMILAGALVLAVGITGIALGTAAEQVSTIDGKITKSKQDKKKYKKAKLFTRVTTATQDGDPFIPSAPTEQIFIDFDDDIKIKLGGVPECSQNLNGTDTTEARALCPNSIVSTDSPKNAAKARVPSAGGPIEVADLTVTAFHGVGNQLLLHAFSPTLTDANTQVVIGSIINSPLPGGDFGKRLSVTDVPDAAGDQGALVDFGAEIKRGGVIKARCKDGNKKWNFRTQWNYESADGTDTGTDFGADKQTCKVKR